MAEAFATVELVGEKNKQGRLQDCVYVQCLESGHVTGPVWGHSAASVRRALAELTSECQCGATFHMAEES